MAPSRERFRAAAARARFAMRGKRRSGSTVHSSGRVFNDWLTRARSDIALLTTELETGPYPYAGIPWFSTAFGRDGVISALQMLWLNPAMARGVLSFLALHQATETRRSAIPSPARSCTRRARAKWRCFASCRSAATMAGSIRRRSTSISPPPMPTAPATWPSSTGCGLRCAGRQPGWKRSARDGGGFVTYKRAAEIGLSNQGWKDSSDAIFHSDGRIPAGPIALVEVQGYVFAAYQGMSALAARRGEEELVAHWAPWRTICELGREAFLDGGRRLLRSRHRRRWRANAPCVPRMPVICSMSACRRPSARKGSRRNCSPRISQRLGHKNARRRRAAVQPDVLPQRLDLAARYRDLRGGLARYNERDSVVRLMSGTFEAAVNFSMRLPELFCGFTRVPGEAPVAYPVACLPQAWSAGSVFMFLQACLGLRVDGWRGEILVDRPRLPIGIDNLVIRRLGVGDANVDIIFERVGDRVVCFRITGTKGPSRCWFVPDRRQKFAIARELLRQGVPA